VAGIADEKVDPSAMKCQKETSEVVVAAIITAGQLVISGSLHELILPVNE